MVAHGKLQVRFFRELLGFDVARVYVADYTHARVGGQNALDALGHFIRAVGYCDLAGVQRVADAYAAAVVN